MSRLRNYGPGELADRLTILALKRLHGLEAKKDCSAWNNEWAILQTEARSKRTLSLEAVLDLAAINAALWTAEDDLRLLRSQEAARHTEEAFYVDVCRVAFRIQSLNDARAAIVDRINSAAGEAAGSDKVSMVLVREEVGQ
jgi:hypothetical protein